MKNSYSFNQDFLDSLEHHISRSLANSPDRSLKFFWCDGIIMPDYSPTVINQNIIKNKQILLKAWFGRSGQDNYSMTILFGPESLSALKNGHLLNDVLPNTGATDWINIDELNQHCTVRLL